MNGCNSNIIQIDSKNIFCTLFDSNYLDKGIVLYKSLLSHCEFFKLYIFCFDDLCHEILNDMKLEHVILITLKDFEIEELLNVKENRSAAEYCWTCTPYTILYVLDTFHEKCCTYIDADLRFFGNPSILLDEIPEDKSVMIVSHFLGKSIKDRIVEKLYGKYCVQFNYFENNEKGRTVLEWWKKRCLDWCYAKIEKDRMGDQKYLNKFITLFPQVYELAYRGGGMAPWNFKQYKLNCYNTVSCIGRDYEIIFYHFQNLRYINNNSVNINVGNGDTRLKKYIYCIYQCDIYHTRKMLKENYGKTFDLKKSYSKNIISKFIRRNIMQYIVRNKNDIITYDEAIQYCQKENINV